MGKNLGKTHINRLFLQTKTVAYLYIVKPSNSEAEKFDRNWFGSSVISEETADITYALCKTDRKGVDS